MREDRGTWWFEQASRRSGRSWMLLPLVVALALSWTVVAVAGADDEKPAEDEVPRPQPVDKSMHHFMEYFFEPAYKRLKSEMATETRDNSGWKAVKGDSLTLAEGGNLLLLRPPKEHADEWRRLTAAMRLEASRLYEAARAKDAPHAQEHYKAMIQRCNACHDKFAHGEHQLQP